MTVPHKREWRGRAKASAIVDSILPSEEARRRFQSDLPRVSGLGGSAASRDALVERVIGALEKGDTAAVTAPHVSKSEYAFLYFPTSAYSRKPYELPLDVAWLLSEQNSIKGLRRLTRRLGGKRLGFRGYECGAAVKGGETQFWRSCEVTYSDPASGSPVTKRLFGAIMERGAAYKFLSYSNDF